MFNKFRKYITELINKRNLELEKWKKEDPESYYDYILNVYDGKP